MKKIFLLLSIGNMSYRFMRIIVMFDLPTITSEDNKQYRKFRKYLIKSGFMMLQESVYCKIAVNQSACHYIMNDVRRNKPPKGLVQMFSITEKQFQKMEILVGEVKSDLLTTDERVVVL